MMNNFCFDIFKGRQNLTILKFYGVDIIFSLSHSCLVMEKMHCFYLYLIAIGILIKQLTCLKVYQDIMIQCWFILSFSNEKRVRFHMVHILTFPLKSDYSYKFSSANVFSKVKNIISTLFCLLCDQGHGVLHLNEIFRDLFFASYSSPHPFQGIIFNNSFGLTKVLLGRRSHQYDSAIEFRIQKYLKCSAPPNPSVI